MKKFVFVSSVLLIILSATGVLAWKNTSTKSGSEPQQLEKVFSLIQSRKISFFRDNDWCNVLKYKRGNYTNNQSHNCTWATNTKEKFVSFNESAKKDFEDIQRSLSQPKIYLSEVKFKRTGEIKSARFGVDPSNVAPICRVIWSCDRKTYVYQPNHGDQFPETIPGELWYEKVNQDWYIEWQDWN